MDFVSKIHDKKNILARDRLKMKISAPAFLKVDRRHLHETMERQ